MATLSSLIQNYTSTETLDSVADRGATTNQSLTMGNLTSTGIDDNATSTAITIDASQNVTVGGNFSATKLTALNGTLELDDNGTHNGIINVPASLFINIDSDNTNTGEDFVIAKDRTSTSGGTELFRVQEDGNVGIGLTPSYKLDVDAGAPASSDQVLGRFSSQNGVRDIGFVWDDSASTLGIATLTNHALTFHTNGNSSERMRIDSAGDISVGSASNHSGARIVINDTPPTAFGSPMLQVGQETFTGSGYYSIGLGYTAGSYTEPPAEIAAVSTSSSGGTTADIVFGTRSVTTNTAVTERMRITSSGLVGINENNPTHALHVKGDTSDTIDETKGTLKLQGTTGGNGLIFGTIASSPYTSYIQSAFVADTSLAQYALALNPIGGNVGVGTTSPTSNCKLHLVDADVQIELEGTVGSNSGFINFDGTNLQLSTNRNMKTGAFSNTGKSNATMILRGVSGGSEIRFYTASADNTTASERMRITSNGITFNGDSVAANALDDYEEGTFTPSFTTSGTLTVNSATYTKIGRQVTCRFHLTASTTCSGDITGLPFTPNGESGGVVGYQTHVSGETIGILVQAANVWNLRIGQTQYGLAAGKQIRGMFTYFTDA